MSSHIFTKILLVSLWSICASSVSHAPIDVFPTKQIPGRDSQGKVGPEVCESSFANSTLCSNVSVPTLVPYLVKGAGSAVVIAPGGGFHGLSFSTEGTNVAKWLNGIGVSAFVLKYRVPAQFGYHEVPMMDAQRAVRLVRSRAAQWDLNASRIGFMGFSAGGDLAAGLSANFGVESYARIDSVDDRSSRPDFTLLLYPGVHDWGSYITAEHPPAFFAQMENDPVNSSMTMEYYLKLKAMSTAPSDIHIFHGDLHGYGVCDVIDSEGRIAALVAAPDGPGLMPAWKPWSSVCLWPSLAKAFLQGLGLLTKQDRAFHV